MERVTRRWLTHPTYMRAHPLRWYQTRVTPAIASAGAFLLIVCGPALAAFPGGRGRIAFSVRHYERGIETARIFLVRKDGSKDHPLRNAAAGHSPAWAPGGKRLAFVRCGEPGDSYDSGSCDLWTSRVDGTHQRQLTDTPDVYEGQPAWSGDGRHVVYSACDAGEVVLMDASCDLMILLRRLRP